MGLLLLGMRVGLAESGMFKNLKNDGVSRGNIFMLFNDGKRFKKYLSCILIGIPLWFVVGVLVTFSPEFGKELNATEPLSAGTGIMYCYIGIAIGDIVAGVLSQIWRSCASWRLIRRGSTSTAGPSPWVTRSAPQGRASS